MPSPSNPGETPAPVSPPLFPCEDRLVEARRIIVRLLRECALHDHDRDYATADDVLDAAEDFLSGLTTSER